MPQPTQSQVHVNVPLTNVSIAYMQSMDAFIADKVFPVVPVSKQSDIYPIYTKNDWFRDEAKPRAAGTESAGSGYNVDTSNTYYCGVDAIHKDIADQIRNNADSWLNLDRDATQFVTRRLAIRREKKWVSSFFKSGVWGTDITGVSGTPSGAQAKHWSDATSTPIEDVQAGITAVLKATGFKPNKLTVGWEVFSALRNHPDIVERYKYTTSSSLTADMIAAVLGIANLIVAESVYATNNEGGTPAYDFIHGKHAMLSYSPDTPSLLQPSAGYAFAWTGHVPQLNSAIGVSRFRMDHLKSDRVEGEIAYDMKLIGADLGYFWDGIVA